jgi:hypothetical protein
MATPASVASIPLILKNIWDDDIFDFMYDDQPFLGLLDKDTSWDGLQQLVTVQYGGMAGRAGTFVRAQANQSPTVLAQMGVTTADNFATWAVDHKLITLSRNQRGALVRALADQTEAAMSKLKRSSCWMLWRNGGGAVGQIASIAGSTITLVNIADVRNFDVGDVVDLSADDGLAGAGVRAGTPLTITKIAEDTGVLIFSAGVVASIAGALAADSLFHNGDYNAAATSGTAFTGVAAYVPSSAPGTGGVPASIWGMDRTPHLTRLGGHRFTGTVATAVNDIKNALASAYRRRCEITHLFCSPEVYNAIELSLQGSKRYLDEKVGTVGFKALAFTSIGGKVVKVYQDADIPKSPDGTKTLVYGLNLDSFKFHTADEYPMWLTSVANGSTKFMLNASANQSEGRLGGYGNLICKAPGQNFVLSLT